MKEILYIRISSQEDAAIQWLITNAGQEDEIASGTLTNRFELSQLTEKAADRLVKVLVNGADVRLKSLAIPGKADRAIMAAAPYMLEDDLAHDVEKLFFAFASKAPVMNNNHNCCIAFTLQTQMQQWLDWFKEADIVISAMLPDILAMPLVKGSWTAVQIDEHWLIRSDAWQGLVADESLRDLIISNQLTKGEVQVIETYSPWQASVTGIEIKELPAELPMLLLARGFEQSHFNLMQGPYAIKEQRSPHIRRWLQVAAVAGFALLLNLAGKGIEIMQLNQQYEQINAQISNDYKKAFPKTKKVRINTLKKQLTSKIKDLGGSAESSALLTLVDKLRPAFIKVPSLKPDSFRYDAKRNELRLSVTGKDYQSFEQFKTELEKATLTVETGALNNQGEQVVGSFNIKGRS